MKYFTRTLIVAMVLLFSASMVYSQFLPPRCPGDEACNSGGGTNDDPIVVDWPPFGNIANVTNFIKWQYKSGATSYTLDIFNSDGSQVLYSETTTSNGLKLILPDLGLEVGTEYVIVIRSDNNKVTNLHRFVLKDKSDLDAVLAELENDQIYNSIYGIDKALRKADFLYENGWNLAAAKAHNINVLSNSAMDIMKIINSFEALRLKLYPLD